MKPLVKYAESPGVASSASSTLPPKGVGARQEPRNSGSLRERTGEGRMGERPERCELGATFRGFNHHPDLGWSWEVVCVINRYEEGRLFGWSAGEGEHGRPVVVHRCGRGRPHPPVVPLDHGARPIRAHPGDRGKPTSEDDIVANRLKDWAANMAAPWKASRAWRRVERHRSTDARRSGVMRRVRPPDSSRTSAGRGNSGTDDQHTAEPGEGVGASSNITYPTTTAPTTAVYRNGADTLRSPARPPRSRRDSRR